MNKLIPIVLVSVLSGCSLQQIDDAFSLPALTYSCKYEDCGKSWSKEDFAAYAKMEAEEWQKGSRDVMGYKLPESEDVLARESYNVRRWKGSEYMTELAASIEQINNRAYAYSSDVDPVSGYEGAYPDLPFSTPCLDVSHRAYELISAGTDNPTEMRVVTIVLDDDTLDSRGGPRYGYGLDKHAMLLVDGIVYDNGYLSNSPFDYDELSYYGEEIENIWSPKQYR